MTTDGARGPIQYKDDVLPDHKLLFWGEDAIFSY